MVRHIGLNLLLVLVSLKGRLRLSNIAIGVFLPPKIKGF